MSARYSDLLFDLRGSLADLQEGGAIEQSLLMENTDVPEHDQLLQVSLKPHGGKQKKKKKIKLPSQPMYHNESVQTS